MIEPIGPRARRGPVVLVRVGDEVSPAAATFAARAARHTRVDLRVSHTWASSVTTARELDATVIVVSALPDRWVPRRIAARRTSWLVARTGCAVVSVSPTLSVLPRICVAAMDFSAASIRAAQMALLVLQDCGMLVLVHVRPAHDLSSAQHSARSAGTSDDIAVRFKRLRAELGECAPPGTVIDTQMESGETVGQVLSVAREVEADLVAVGVHSARVRNRIVDFGTAARTLRRAPCSVLASPVARVTRAFRGDGSSRYWATAPEWPESTAP